MVRRRETPPPVPPPPFGLLESSKATHKTAGPRKSHSVVDTPHRQHHLRAKRHNKTPPSSPIRSLSVTPPSSPRSSISTTVTPVGILRRESVSSRSSGRRHVTFARKPIVFLI